ncbi:MAG: transposase [Cypionkella sp.]
MKTSRYTETPILGRIKAQEVGLPVAQAYQKLGLSPASLYKLEARYQGVAASNARKALKMRTLGPSGWWRILRTPWLAHVSEISVRKRPDQKCEGV